MSTTAAALQPAVALLLPMLEREHKTTIRVLQAVPGDKLDFKPHERNFSAGDLAWHVAYAQYGLASVVAAGRFEGFGQPPVTPKTVEEIVAGCESYHRKACDLLAGLTAEQLQAGIPLPNGHSIPAHGLLWSGVLFHEIHHRGQLAIYIRMMGGKVPSIYGPSGDDNPFA